MYYLIYFLALISLSQASIIIRWSKTHPLILGSWRLLLAAIIIRIFYELKVKKKGAHHHLSSQQWGQVIGTGFLFFLHLFSYAYSAQTIPISHLMLIYSCNPAFTSMGNLIFFKEKITRYHLFAFFLSFFGIYILFAGQLHSAPSQWHGEVAAILAAITFSAYSLMSKHSRRKLPNSFMTPYMYLAASFCFFLMTFLTVGAPLPLHENGWMGILLLALIPTILGHSSYTYCMNFIDIQILSLGKLIEPIFSAVSAFFFFNESITVTHVFSFAFIVAGISIIILKPKIL